MKSSLSFHFQGFTCSMLRELIRHKSIPARQHRHEIIIIVLLLLSIFFNKRGKTERKSFFLSHSSHYVILRQATYQLRFMSVSLITGSSENTRKFQFEQKQREYHKKDSSIRVSSATLKMFRVPFKKNLHAFHSENSYTRVRTKFLKCKLLCASCQNFCSIDSL